MILRQPLGNADEDGVVLVDGREAVTFLVALKNAIEDPTRILIDL